MADTSLFTRLRRLFSNDVIIRNVGGKQLKVMDVDRIQKYGNLESNSLYDRFTRLHRPVGSSLQYNPTLNYSSMRLQLYSDYEAMDYDSLIAPALDIISEEATLKNEYGDVLTIKSSNENVKRVLHNLFYDVLNVEFNLPSWVRQMCKYGDFYLHLQISEKFGIYNALPLSVYQVVREEGTDPENPNYVQYILDPNGLSQSNTYSARRSDQMKLENYEVAHFRLLSDAAYLPYGRSYLEPARKVFKQLILMEDAMLIHRIMRAPEKRIFYMNVGGIPPNEIDNFMEKTVRQMKKTPYVDQNTGDYNLKFNIQNMTEDFYIPVRGNDSSTKIETTKGLDYDGTTDIEYLKNRMLAALKIPKAFLGYDENLEGKSTLAAMDIRFARTIERLQRTIVSELHKIALVHLYTQGFTEADLVDFELALTGPSIVFEQEKTDLYKSKVELANSISDKKILSSDFVYKNIFNLSDAEIDFERNKALDDAAHIFRLNQIENEGNDPVESGESYGTPHDLAGLYSTKRDKTIKDVPDGYDEEKPGRPAIKFSRYDTDQANMGRDPLGKAGLTADDTPSRTNDVSTFALEENSRLLKKLSLTRLRGKEVLSETDKNSLLDEKNIINE
ncbi:portal protein [bacterium]|nr:portal protein [bacterium]